MEADFRSALMSIEEICHLRALSCHALINFVCYEANPIVLEHFLVLELYVSDINSEIAHCSASVNASNAQLPCQHVGFRRWFS